MKIALCTEDFDLYNMFQSKAPKYDFEIINAKVESVTKELIHRTDIDAYVFSNTIHHTQKSIDNIRKTNQWVPKIVICDDVQMIINSADIWFVKPDKKDVDIFVDNIIQSIFTYIHNFGTLKKLTIKNLDVVYFGQCSYDPTRKILYHKDKKIKQLSTKEGDILQALATDFKKIIPRVVVLEKVWRKNDYFSGRSMDVYISNLRKLFKINKIDLNIKNITGVGLVLE
jgi:DNA-binding response OmpR family regulator